MARATALASLVLAGLPAASYAQTSATFNRFVPPITPAARAYSAVAKDPLTVTFTGGVSDSSSNSAPGDLVVTASSFALTQQATVAMPLSQAAVCSVPEHLLASVPGGYSAFAFGGIGTDGKESNAIFAYDATSVWRQYTTATGTAPLPRRGASCSVLASCPGTATGGMCVVIVGGVSSTRAATAADNVWILSLSSPFAWQLGVTTGAIPPAGLNGQATATLPALTGLVVYGGTSPQGGVSSDTYQLSAVGYTDAAATAAEMTNLALLRPATGSSTAPTTAAPLGNTTGASAAFAGSAVDGNTVQTFGTGACFVSYFNTSLGIAGTTDPWWRVDLGSPQAVYQLRVWMRTDALGTMNSGIQFWVSNNTQLPWNAGTNAIRFPNPYPDPIYSPTILISQSAIVGQYVWAVQRGPARMVQLCELQVLTPVRWMWRQLSGQVNLALNKYATSSAVSPSFSYGDPQNVVDGATATVVRTPNPISSPYVMIDLGRTYRIDKLSVLDGAGSNFGRNNATEIILGDSADPTSPTNGRCYGPAMISCYLYNRAPAGMTQNAATYFGANGIHNSKFCTANDSPISPPDCSGEARYIILRKTDSNVVSPWGMYMPFYPFGEQCKYQLSAATIATIPGCNGPCPVTPKPFPTCGQCPVLNSTFCTTAPYGQWGGEGLSDAQMLVIGEIWAYGNSQRYNPPGRVGAAYATYGNRLVVFGGQDANGFLLQDTVYFNLDTLSWEPAVVVLGTPPPARAFAAMTLMPSGRTSDWGTDIVNSPSNTLVIFGGTGPASTYNDISKLSFPACPALINVAGAGFLSITCYVGGTVCAYTCLGPLFVPANPSGIVSCQPDGTWSGQLPLCSANPGVSAMVPSAPTLAAPVQNTVGTGSLGQGSLNFTISPPGSPGYSMTSVAGYLLSSTPKYWMTRFAGQDLDLSTFSIVANPTGSTLSHQYAIAKNGYLFMGTAPSGTCTFTTQNCFIITRPFPTGGDLPAVSDAWTLEAGVSFNYWTVNAPVTGNQIGIGLFNTDTPLTVVNPLNASQNIAYNGGALHFYTGLRVTATSTNQGGWQSVNQGGAVFSNGATQLYNNGITGSTFGYFRIDRVPYETAQSNVTVNRPGYGSWRFGMRYNPLWPWSWSAWMSDAALLRKDAQGLAKFNPATARIALVGVAQSTTARSWGEIRYIRFGRLEGFQADPPGPVFNFPHVGTMTNPQALSTPQVFVQGATLSFSVQAYTSLGVGASSLVTSPVVTPIAPTAPWNPATLVEVAYQKPTGGVDWGGVLPTGGTTAGNYASGKGVDGVINVPTVTSVPGFVNYASHTMGSWWWVDLLIPTAVKEFVLYNRQDAGWSNIDSFKLLVFNELYESGNGALNGGPPVGTMCDPSQVPTSIGPTDVYNGYVAAKRFNCSWPRGLVGRYVTLINGAGFVLNFREIQIYATNSCPARTATAATQVPGTNCAAGAPYGAVCTHECNSGYFPLSGSSSSTCNGDSWNDPPLVCVPQCPLLAAPTNVATCAQVVYEENFSNPAQVATRWTSMNEGAPVLGPHAFAINGALQINSGLGVVGTGTILTPQNSDIQAWTGGFTVSADIYTDATGEAGLAWRVQSTQDYYRLHLDMQSQVHYVERMRLGISWILTRVDDFPEIAPNTWVNIAVTVDTTNTFTITVNGELMTTVSDSYIGSGTVGVSAMSYAQFDNFKYTIACSDCQNAKPGMRCSFTCSPGLIAVGVSDVSGGPYGTRSCVTQGSSAVWSPATSTNGGVDMQCTLPSPYFPTATLSVLSFAPVNTLVGSPLVATITSPSYTILYSVSGGVNASYFYVDSCSGQLKVRQAGLNWLVQKKFVLNVTAYVADFPLSTTTTAITVNVLEVDLAPVATPTTFTVPENSPANRLVGTVPVYDANSDNITCSLDVDGSGGKFMVTPSCGIYVTATGAAVDALNYEATASWPYRLTIRVTENSAMRGPITGTSPALYSTAVMTIALSDTDDVPQVTATLLWAAEADANAPGPTGVTLVATDQDNTANGNFSSPLRFALIPPAQSSNYSACSSLLTTRPPYRYPTVDGTPGGTPLFSVDPTTGVLTTTASPSPSLSNNGAFPPFGYNSVAARIIYVLCVNVSEAAFNGWAVGAVPVGVQADVTALPVIVSTAPAVFPTTGGTLTLSGSNFGNPGVRFTSMYGIADDGSGRRINATSCMVVNNATVTCVVPEGSGALYNINLLQALTGSPADLTAAAQSTNLQWGYNAPTVTSAVVTAPVSGLLSTSIGGNVTFTGRDFSPQTAADAVTIMYGSGAGPFTGPLACSNRIIKTTLQPHTSIVCAMPPYYSSAWGWTLTVGGQQVSNLPAQTISYEVPVITSIAPMTGTCPGVSTVCLAASTFTPTTLDPLGGQILRLRGSGFGPSDAVITVTGTYGGLSFASCKHALTNEGVDPSTTVYCVTVPGVGAGLAVRLTVGNQVSGVAATTLTYVPPVLTSATVAAPMPTQGGVIITVTGSGFGPAGYVLGNQVTSFTYGPKGDEGRYLVPTAACAVVDNAKVTCTAVQGVGMKMWAVITIGGQASAPFAAGLSYAAPILFVFNGDGTANADTVGGQGVTITGTNFGPADAYTNSLLQVTYGVPVQHGPGNLTQLRYVAASCAIDPGGHVSITCNTAAGAGTRLQWKVVVAGQESAQPTTSYAAPQIDSIVLQNQWGSLVASADVTGGTLAILTGRFFGPNAYSYNGSVPTQLVQAMSFGVTGTSYVLPLSAVTVISHTQISVLLPPGSGRGLGFLVTVAEQQSALSTATFRYAQPIITSMTPRTSVTSSNDRTQVTLAVRNLPLTDTLSLIYVKFGNGAAQQQVALSNQPKGPEAIAAASNGDGTVNVAFQLPSDEAGLNLAVAIVINSATNGAQVDQSPPVMFNYKDPQIGAVVVARPHFDGSNSSCLFGGNPNWDCQDPALMQLTLYGQSFGTCKTDNQGSCLPAAQQVDKTDKSLQQLAANYSSLPITAMFGELWCGMSCSQDRYTQPLSGVAQTQMVWVQSWTHDRIVAYIKATAATIRVLVTSYSETNDAQVQEVQRVFTQASPQIGSLVGSVSNLPTVGGTPLQLAVYNLGPGDYVEVRVGGRLAPRACACGTFTGAGASDSNACVAALITSALNSQPQGTAVPICVSVPSGQGTRQQVQVTRVNTAGDRDTSNLDFTVDYAAPFVAQVELLEGTAVSQSVPAVRARVDTLLVPTNGTATVRVTGSNLGLAPILFMGDWMAAGPAPAGAMTAMYECAGTVGTHTCWLFPAAPGEGSGGQGSQSSSYVGGYTLFLEAGGQDGTQFKMSYRSPVATRVTAASTLGELPTAGGITVNITGYDFGSRPGSRPDTDSAIAVTFVGDDGGDPLACSNPVRLSTTLLQCTLPEGSGATLKVRMQVAGLTGPDAPVMHYSPPTVTAAYVVPRIMLPASGLMSVTTSLARGAEIVRPANPPSGAPFLELESAGGEYVVLEGSNFGTLDTDLHCVFLAWQGRDLGQAVQCDKQESYVGEGEVPGLGLAPVTYPFAVAFWSHNLVVFTALPGIGLREVIMNVRGGLSTSLSRPSTAIPVHYRAPVLNLLNPALGDTEGGTLITLTGSGFGPRYIDTSDPVRVPTFPMSIDAAVAVPTASLVIVLQGACVTMRFDAAGRLLTGRTVETVPGVRVPLSSCNEGFVSAGRTDGTLVFSLPPGVGSHKNLTVQVVDSGTTPAISSDVWDFSYKTPRVATFRPSSVVLVTPGQPASLTAYGSDFGNFLLEDSQHWSPAERLLDAQVAGLPVSSVGRSRQPQLLTEALGTVVSVTFDPTNLAAGGANFTLRIAGQTAFVAAWQPVDNDTTVATNALIIGCRAGSYAHVGEVCVPCPAQFPDNPSLTGASCAGFIDFSVAPAMPFSARFPYPRPLKGWYNLNASDSYKLQWDPDGPPMSNACPDGFKDNGRDVCIVPCNPPESCLGDNRCAEGYTSKGPEWRCSYCDTGYYHQAGRCVKCPDSPVALIVGFLLLVIFAGAVGFLLNQKSVNIAVIGIGIDFFQVLAIFAQSGVKWPPTILELLHVLSAFNLNIEIVAPECLVPNISYRQKFWFIMLLPLSVGGLLGLVFLYLTFYKAVIMGKPKKHWFTHKHALGASTLALVYVLYLYLTRTIFDVFNCTPTIPSDGYLHMTVANNERCGVPGGTQLILMPSAVAGLIVYSLGYPAFIAYVLYKNRELAMEDQLLRAKGVGGDKLTNPHAFDLRMLYGRTYMQFKPGYILWSLAVILRKFLIAITAVVFSKNASFQMAACLLIMFLAYAAQTAFRPYMNAGEFDEVLRTQADKALRDPLAARLAVRIGNIESRGRKRTRKNLLNLEGKVDRTAVLGVLTSWLFNYNTIEQTMLFATVIVCLMGIMYQANEVNTYYPESKDGVTAVVLITIIGAIVYFFTVVIGEIVVLYNEDARAKQLAKANAARKAGGKEGEEVKTTRTSVQAGRLVDQEGNLQLGQLDTQVNPLFTNIGAKGGSGDTAAIAVLGGGSDGDAGQIIAESRDPPPPELWRVFQHQYIEQSAAVKALRGQVQELQRAAQLSAESADLGVARPTTASRRGAKTEFGPVDSAAASGQASAAPRAAKGAGGRAGVSMKALKQ